MALKQVRPVDNESRNEWNQLYREVETLQKRRHPNIVPLLASYDVNIVDASGRPLRTMFLLLPWAPSDLEHWMASKKIPGSLRDLSRSERRARLYSLIFDVISGLASLHREIGGKITSHHDLKPSNILIIGGTLKIADLGRSHLRIAAGGSSTDGATGLGTYEYQPPEYWRDDGLRAKMRHGRAFDAWSMGCILVEFATLILYDWESQMVSQFRRRRERQRIKNRPELAKQRNPDSSFHNNRSTVQEWISELKTHKNSDDKLIRVLDVAIELLVHDPDSRCYTWEAEGNLYDILKFSDDHIASLGHASSFVQSPTASRGHVRVPNGIQTPLHRAAIHGDSAKFMDLIECGWPLFVQDQRGLTALDIVENNCENHIRIKFPWYFGQSESAGPAESDHGLLRAAKAGDSSVVRRLLRENANPLLVDQDGRSPLHLAIGSNHATTIDALLDSHVSAQEQFRQRDNTMRRTPLHEASANGRDDIIRKLLRYGPELEDRQAEGKTAVFLAVEYGHEAAVQTLLENVPSPQIFTLAVTKNTPIHEAAISTVKINILRRLLKAKDADSCLKHANSNGETPLWLALYHGNFVGFQMLRDRKASIRTSNRYGDTLLHVVAEKGLTDFLTQNIDNFFLSDFDARNRKNETPLMIARRRGFERIIKLFEERIDSDAVASVSGEAPSLGSAPGHHDLFYSLGSGDEWLRPNFGGYWRRLTFKSYEVYERIYKLASNDQSVVWCELLLTIQSHKQKR